jgi:hypothetical protein
MERAHISPAQAIEEYISRIQDVYRRKRGTDELSYRTPLENLLTAVGEQLEPQVSVTQELADDGAGRTRVATRSRFVKIGYWLD